jgi:DNA-binding transcriptional LysR family regulator
MAIKRLEDSLNCRLFDRSSKGLELTDSAKFLLPVAEKVVKLIDECETYFSTGRGKDQRLSVYLTWGARQEFAETPIERFKKNFPCVYLKLREDYDSVCETAVDTLEAELALCSEPTDSELFESEPLYSVRYCIAVRKDHPLAATPAVNIRDLDGKALVLMRENQKTFSVISAAARRAGVALVVDKYVDNALLTNQYVDLMRSIGISTVSMGRKVPAANLRFIPFDDAAISWNLCLIWKRGKELSDAAQSFRNMLAAHRDEFPAEQPMTS